MLSKLGTCARCMRLAFLGSLFFLLLATTNFAWPPPSATLSTLVNVGLAAFAALWFAHIGAYVARSVADLRHIRRLRGLPAPMWLLLRRAVTRARRAVVLSIPRLVGNGILGLTCEKDPCECYFDDECFAWRICDYAADCERLRKGTEKNGTSCPKSERSSTGSCDGMCANSRELALMNRERLIGAIQSYFELYAGAARTPEGTGLPGREQLATIERTLTASEVRVVRRFVYSLLDVLLGWDIAFSNPEAFELETLYQDAFLAHVADAEATPALLEAAGSGLVTGLRAGDPDQVAPPLIGFWEAHPDYRPEHMGRCYPHGGHRYYESAVDCHIAHLRRFVAAVVAS